MVPDEAIKVTLLLSKSSVGATLPVCTGPWKSCATVLPRSAFVQRLPELLSQ